VKASRARCSRGRHWRWSWGFVTINDGIIVLFETMKWWFLEAWDHKRAGPQLFKYEMPGLGSNMSEVSDRYTNSNPIQLLSSKLPGSLLMTFKN
jgi:hypothetical protein